MADITQSTGVGGGNPLVATGARLRQDVQRDGYFPAGDLSQVRAHGTADSQFAGDSFRDSRFANAEYRLDQEQERAWRGQFARGTEPRLRKRERELLTHADFEEHQPRDVRAKSMSKIRVPDPRFLWARESSGLSIPQYEVSYQQVHEIEIDRDICGREILSELPTLYRRHGDPLAQLSIALCRSEMPGPGDVFNAFDHFAGGIAGAQQDKQQATVEAALVHAPDVDGDGSEPDTQSERSSDPSSRSGSTESISIGDISAESSSVSVSVESADLPSSSSSLDSLASLFEDVQNLNDVPGPQTRLREQATEAVTNVLTQAQERLRTLVGGGIVSNPERPLMARENQPPELI